ncbi:hypothetical protein HPB49_014689 [Dermacentor silvarum]|uniref:Uncharacterized protein n=1 Tax=Dermacentor silvarum TaxID=543639 RepID=A0ACB8DDP0_DERSI|nr:hypothetical protein HPB49_014689 [Dermacentor silvarum]
MGVRAPRSSQVAGELDFESVADAWVFDAAVCPTGSCLPGWSIGYYKTSLTPTCRGFDSFYGYYNGEEDYYTHSITHENHTGLDFWLNTEPLFAENGSYSTTLYTERAQYLIRNRNKSKPFFLMLSHQSPHGAGEPEPFQAPQENVDKFPYIGEKNRTIYAAVEHEVARFLRGCGDHTEMDAKRKMVVY